MGEVPYPVSIDFGPLSVVIIIYELPNSCTNNGAVGKIRKSLWIRGW